MFETLAVFLVLLWAFAYFSAYTLGGAIHLLLVAAAAIAITRFLQSQRI